MKYRLPAGSAQFSLNINEAEEQMHGVAWMGGTSAEWFHHPAPGGTLPFMDSIQGDLALLVVLGGNGYYNSYLWIQKWADEGRTQFGVMKDWVYTAAVELSSANKRFVPFIFRNGPSLRDAGFDTESPEWVEAMTDVANAIATRLAVLPGFYGVAWDWEYSSTNEETAILRGFDSKADYWDWVMNPARPGGFFSIIRQAAPHALFLAQPNSDYAGSQVALYTRETHGFWTNHENWQPGNSDAGFTGKIDRMACNEWTKVLGISCDQSDLGWHVALDPEEHTWHRSGGWVKYNGAMSHAIYALLHNPQYISFTWAGFSGWPACPVCGRTNAEFDALKSSFIATMGQRLRQIPHHPGVVARWGDTTQPTGSHPDIATTEGAGLGYMLDSGNQLWATNWSNSPQIIGINWGSHTASTTLPGYSFAVFALDQTGIIQLT